LKVCSVGQVLFAQKREDHNHGGDYCTPTSSTAVNIIGRSLDVAIYNFKTVAWFMKAMDVQSRVSTPNIPSLGK